MSERRRFSSLWGCGGPHRQCLMLEVIASMLVGVPEFERDRKDALSCSLALLLMSEQCTNEGPNCRATPHVLHMSGPAPFPRRPHETRLPVQSDWDDREEILFISHIRPSCKSREDGPSIRSWDLRFLGSEAINTSGGHERSGICFLQPASRGRECGTRLLFRRSYRLRSRGCAGTYPA